MKITLIIHSLGIGGMERVMVHLLEEFSKYENVELHLLLIGNKREVLYTLPKNVVIHKPIWEFDNNKRKLHTLKTISFIRKSLKDIDPDTVLSFGEIWNNLVLLATLGLKVPIYVSDRSIPGKNLGRFQNFLRNKLYPKASGFIAQTEKAEKVAIKSGWNNNIIIIGNPVAKFEQNSVIDRKNIVLMVSRLIPTKNVNRLMHMFSDANKSNNWHLKVVGGNAKKMNLLEDYRNFVNDNKLTDTIHLEGEQKGIKMYYSEASIFAFTSTSEGFPNALAEAMAAGCACIAYDCMAGPSDLIDNGINGFLIPEHNEAQFQEKLLLLMQNEALRVKFANAAKEKIKKFETKEIAKQFFNFINK
jgi:GalNAc-alpha-(1->4)-GalNAc-alpha-(1->3)-diNAcBac-PP-undecaprenol alpha-1,4-N-acetyl-D-galactosaminyltransferase